MEDSEYFKKNAINRIYTMKEVAQHISSYGAFECNLIIETFMFLERLFMVRFFLGVFLKGL